MSECTLRVRVTPRSGKNEVKVVDGQIKVWVTAPPADGEANDAVCRVLAKALDLAPSAVTIVGGSRGRAKWLRAEGITMDAAIGRLSGR